MFIIGIDPGLRNVGFGVIYKDGQKLTYIKSGVLKIKVENSLDHRLRDIFTQLTDVINEFKNKYKPEKIHGSIEEIFVNKNGKTTLLLGHARAACMLALTLQDIELSTYSPNQIKKTLSGFGHADKMQMIKMVNLLLPKAPVLKADEADALGIAICFAMNNQNYKESA